MSVVFAGNLPRGYRKEELLDLLGKYQPDNVVLKSNYAFLTYDSRSDAEDVIYECNGAKLNGNRIVLDKQRKQTDRKRWRSYGRSPSPAYKKNKGRFYVVVADIPSVCSWQDIKDFAREHGAPRPLTTEVVRRDGSQAGLIAFRTRHDMEDAIYALDYKKIRPGRGAPHSYKPATVHAFADSSCSHSRSRSYNRYNRSWSRSRSYKRARSISRSPYRRGRSRSRSHYRSRDRDTSYQIRKKSKSPRRKDYGGSKAAIESHSQSLAERKRSRSLRKERSRSRADQNRSSYIVQKVKCRSSSYHSNEKMSRNRTRSRSILHHRKRSRSYSHVKRRSKSISCSKLPLKDDASAVKTDNAEFYQNVKLDQTQNNLSRNVEC